MRNRYSVNFRPVVGAVVAVIAGVLSSSAWAQGGLTASQIARDSEFGVSDLMLPKFAPESEADDDLGIQLVMDPRAAYQPFTLLASTGYFFTDNANLSDTVATEDNVFVASVALSYLPVISGNLYGEATVRDQLFRYNNLSELDFNALDAGAGLIYVLRGLGDLSVYTRYNFAQFWDSSLGSGDLYSNHSIQTGAYKGWIIKRNQYLYASWMSDVSLSGNPGYAKRDDHNLTLGYRLTPMPKVKADFYYRLAYLNFSERGREDWNSSTGAALTYNFTKNFYASGYVSYTDNDSNIRVNGNYKVWQTGVRLGGYWNF